MGALQILWRLLSADELSKLGDDLAKIEHDDNQMATDFLALLQQATKVALDYKRMNADLGPVIKMLQQLKG